MTGRSFVKCKFQYKDFMNPDVFVDFEAKRESIAVVGLGYVGLPLAALFARRFKVYGFDINAQRVKELGEGLDRTRELSTEQLRQNPVEFTTDAQVLALSRLIIVTVPTPIDEHKNPDLTPLVRASAMIGQHIKPGTLVVYESTVYPGCTEQECIPLIERASGLKWKKDFFVGYSPERINPGDKEHTVEKIKKVVSGDLPSTATLIQKFYGAVITAGTFIAESIATAEAAKVIENTQRDLNIALMNELSLIFSRMGLNTLAVLEAAGTKWNFLPFRPGLVGGHCIGVDPYYLTHKAESLGYHPQVILAGRRINDGMGKVIVEQTVKRLIACDRPVRGCKVLILGWTFKENVPDIRNTRVIDIYHELQAYGIEPLAFDTEADTEEVKHEYGVDMISDVSKHGPYSAVVLAVKHRSLVAEYTLEKLKTLGNDFLPVLVDVKGFFHAADMQAAGFKFFQL